MGWSSTSRGCFKVVEGLASHTTADDHCQAYGGRLTRLSTAAVEAAVQELLYLRRNCNNVFGIL